MNYIWTAISGLSALITIILWAKDNLKEKPSRLIYPILIVLLTVFATYSFEQNRKLTGIREEALLLVKTWPSVDHLKFVSKGERIGVILGGLGFLEKHKSDFPETYRAATNIVKNRLSDFNAPKNDDDSYKEYGLLEDGAGSMIQLVSSIAR